MIHTVATSREGATFKRRELRDEPRTVDQARAARRE